MQPLHVDEEQLELYILLDAEIAAYNRTHELDTPEKRLRALAERIDTAKQAVRERFALELER